MYEEATTYYFRSVKQNAQDIIRKAGELSQCLATEIETLKAQDIR